MRGAAMVEMAISVSLFLLLVFAIIEFALAIFDWSRVVEATRSAARYAIVHDPAIELATEDQPCTNPDGSLVLVDGEPLSWSISGGVDFDCASGVPGCDIVEHIRPLLQVTQTINTEQAKLFVTYTCSKAGYAAHPITTWVYEVTVRSESFLHPFFVPTLLGLPAELTIPPFSTTRLGEDMQTMDPT